MRKISLCSILCAVIMGITGCGAVSGAVDAKAVLEQSKAVEEESKAVKEASRAVKEESEAVEELAKKENTAEMSTADIEALGNVVENIGSSRKESEAATTISYKGNEFDMSTMTYLDFLAFLQSAKISVVDDARNDLVDAYYYSDYWGYEITYRENGKEHDISVYLYNPYNEEKEIKDCRLWCLYMDEDMLNVLTEDVFLFGGTFNIKNFKNTVEVVEMMNAMGFKESYAVQENIYTTQYIVDIPLAGGFEKKLSNGQECHVNFAYSGRSLDTGDFDYISEIEFILTPLYEY